MSDIKQMWKRHAQEIDDLRKVCCHPKDMITIRHDKSSIGLGTLHGAVVVTCTNCGTQKIIFDLSPDKRKKVKKQLSRQGFKDERIGGYAQYKWELEKV